MSAVAEQSNSTSGGTGDVTKVRSNCAATGRASAPPGTELNFVYKEQKLNTG